MTILDVTEVNLEYTFAFLETSYTSLAVYSFTADKNSLLQSSKQLCVFAFR
jgi:hypothetical protein